MSKVSSPAPAPAKPTASPSFVRGMALTFGTNLAQLALGVATSVLAARVLGPHEFGHYGVAQLFAFIIIIFSNCGLFTATSYNVSRGTHPLRVVIVNGVMLSLSAGAAAMVAGALFAWLLGPHVMPGVSLPVFLLALLLVPVTHVGTTLRGVLLGQQRFEVLSVVTTAEMAARLVGIGIAVGILRGGVGMAVASTAAGVALVSAGTLLYLRAEWRGARWRFDPEYVRGTMRYGTKAYLANSVQFLNYRMDMLILNGWHGPLAVGFYSIAVLFAERLGMISGAAATVLMPRVAASDEGHNDVTPTVARIVFLLTVGAALVFFLISGPLVRILYSSAYLPAVAPLQILLIGMMALSLTDVVAMDFTARGRPEVNTVISGGTLLLNVAACLVLVPAYGTLGAAWATALVYTVQATVFVTYYVRVTGKSPLDMLVIRREDLARVRRMLASRRAGAPS